MYIYIYIYMLTPPPHDRPYIYIYIYIWYIVFEVLLQVFLKSSGDTSDATSLTALDLSLDKMTLKVGP